MKTTNFSRAMLILSAIALIASLFVPIWRIYLDAPQYPEGLSLQIWANAITGDVEIINGLNHYIGMKTLHTEDFIEFTMLPYIIVAFAILFLMAVFVGSKKWLYIAFWAFAVFCVIAMVDFWKWEYDYGHNLNPHAAIKVPGMAYQPPLIGFKQLLNFGAFSIPDIGGWLLVGVGVLLLIAALIESGFLSRFKKNTEAVASIALLIVAISSCGNKGPEVIVLNRDACTNCKMSISEGNFAAQFITQKGRVYKFDDLSCMIAYAAENLEVKVESYYVGDYSKVNEQTDATLDFYVHSETIKSPMGGHVAAFSNKTSAEKLAAELGVALKNWNDIKATLSIIKKNERRR